MTTHQTKLILCCILLFIAPLSLSAASYNKLVVFGDSLSDNGNLAVLPQYSFLNSPPYQRGFTNGPKAVEQLASLLNIQLTPAYYFTNQQDHVFGNNFAIAGARAAGNTVIDLNAQVAAFLNSQPGIAPDDALYVLFIGGNDVRDMRNQSNEKSAKAILELAVHNIQYDLALLNQAGAKHFLVVNAPDIGKLPETKLLAAASNPTIIRKSSQQTSVFNERLLELSEHFAQSKDVQLVVFDLRTFFDALMNNGSAYHFSDTQDACYSSVMFSFYSSICDQAKLDSFVFFDELHPTRRVHERLGRALFAAIPEAN